MRSVLQGFNNQPGRLLGLLTGGLVIVAVIATAIATRVGRANLAVVLLVVLGGALLAWLSSLRGRARAAIDWSGGLVGAVLFAVLFRATGGFGSPFVPFLVVIPVASALTPLPPWRLAVNLTLAVLAALSPGLYMATPEGLLAEMLGTTTVWIVLTVLSYVQVHRLEETDRLKNLFLSATSHELRTPLTVIRGVSETLLRPDLPLDGPVGGTLVQRLGANVERLDRLLGDLLDVDRLTRGAGDLQLTRVDFGEVVRTVVAHFDGPMPFVRVEADGVQVHVDRPKIERVIENLLANALKHTPQDTPIWIWTEARDDAVELCVEDAGPGVPPGMRERIFRPFVQQHRDGQEDPQPGTGIGLALVHEFVRLHGGRVWVEDSVHGGAAFRVLLPRVREPSDEHPPQRPARSKV